MKLCESEWSHGGGHVIYCVQCTGKGVRLYHHEDPLSFFR